MRRDARNVSSELGRIAQPDRLFKDVCYHMAHIPIEHTHSCCPCTGRDTGNIGFTRLRDSTGRLNSSRSPVADAKTSLHILVQVRDVRVHKRRVVAQRRSVIHRAS